MIRFSWRRLGRVFDPQALAPYPWMQEFAQCPTPFVLDDETIRVIVSTRPTRDADGSYVSHPGYVDISRKDPRDAIGISPAPLLPLGAAGMFDEFGIMPSSLVTVGEISYLYYTGWTRMVSVPFSTAIGLAISRDGGRSFAKAGNGPLLGIALDDPYLVNTPIVRIVDGTWHMWYVTGKRWLDADTGPEIVLRVAHATSSDGLAWDRSCAPVIQTLLDDECQDMFCPIRIGDCWHAFFAFRHATGFRTDRQRSYRLGHAWSRDLHNWIRDDHAGLDRPETGWDALMICSSQFLEVDGRYLMFYCGNDFGRSGFGIAELLTA